MASSTEPSMIDVFLPFQLADLAVFRGGYADICQKAIQQALEADSRDIRKV